MQHTVMTIIGYQLPGEKCPVPLKDVCCDVIYLHATLLKGKSNFPPSELYWQLYFVPKHQWTVDL